LQALLRQPGVRIMNMAQSGALIQRYPYLSPSRCGKACGLCANVPETDASLVATKAALLVRDDLHSRW